MIPQSPGSSHPWTSLNPLPLRSGDPYIEPSGISALPKLQRKPGKNIPKANKTQKASIKKHEECVLKSRSWSFSVRIWCTEHNPEAFQPMKRMDPNSTWHKKNFARMVKRKRDDSHGPNPATWPFDDDGSPCPQKLLL